MYFETFIENYQSYSKKQEISSCRGINNLQFYQNISNSTDIGNSKFEFEFWRKFIFIHFYFNLFIFQLVYVKIARLMKSMTLFKKRMTLPRNNSFN